MIENMKNMLETAKKNKIAIGQFNINNLEWTRYILEASQKAEMPVILGVSEGAMRYIGGPVTVVNIVRGLIEDLSLTIPIAIHLDHGSSFESCKKCIDAGFSSVMIDASKYDLQENIRITKDVVEYAHLRNVTVEAEIGHIGGEEDGVASELAYATLEDCVALVKATNVDFLAPAAGSVHGLYKGEPKIDMELINSVREATDIPLVLHGGSGLPNEIITNAIYHGICKININTQIQIEWNKAIRKFVNENDNVYDPRKVISSGKQAILDIVGEKIKLFKREL